MNIEEIKKQLAEDGINPESNDCQAMLSLIEEFENDFVEQFGPVLDKLTKDGSHPLSHLADVIGMLLSRRAMNCMDENPLDIFMNAGLAALRTFGKDFGIGMKDIHVENGNDEGKPSWMNLDFIKDAEERVRSTMESLRNAVRDDAETAQALVVMAAGEWGIKHPDEDIMVSIFQPAFEKLGMNVRIHMMTTLGADFTKDL